MKIEKNIPMPEDRHKWVELANEMKVGDSVLVKKDYRSPCKKLSAFVNRRVKLRLAIQRKKHGKAVTAKQNCGNIVRVWRKT